MTACRQARPITPALTVRCKLVTPIRLLSGDYRVSTGWTYQHRTGDCNVLVGRNYHTPHWWLHGDIWSNLPHTLLVTEKVAVGLTYHTPTRRLQSDNCLDLPHTSLVTKGWQAVGIKTHLRGDCMVLVGPTYLTRT